MSRVVIIFCIAAPLLAQTNTGSVTGTVFDQRNAVIPGAKVTAINLATNVAQNTYSTSAGAYNIASLVPGNYRIAVQAPGFVTSAREPVAVETSHAVTLDFTLAVGQTSSQITVTAEVPLVQQANAVIQYEVNQKAVEELPLANQSVLGVLNVIPGVVGEIGSEQTSITTGEVMPGTAISIAGARMGSTQYKADGVNNNALYLGRISLSFSSDAIQEVSVQQNGYSAEFGRVGGGVVNMTTRSGTKDLHGTAFSFVQNDILNAGPYTNSWRQKGIQRYWRGGVDVGGPVWLPRVYDGQKKTFFFFSYEPLRQSSTMSGFGRYPTELERNGDFSQSFYDRARKYPVMIFRQFEFNESGTALTNKRIVLQAGEAYPQWPGNKIPKQYWSKTGKALLDLFPSPNYPTQLDGTNYSIARGVHNTDNRILVKLDQVLSSRNRASFRIARAPTRGDRWFQGGKGSIADNTPSDISLGTNALFSDTHTWGSNKVNEFRAGFTRSNIARTANATQLSKNWFQELGVPSKLDRGMPRVALELMQPFAADAGSHEVDNSLQLNDVLNWTKGKHNIKVGIDFLAPQQNLKNLTPVQGNWSFNNSMTNIGNGNTSIYPGLTTPNATTGFSVASILLGFPNSITMASTVVPYQYRWKYYAAFLQDDYKVTPRLTVNLGVRYQVEVPRSEKHHNQGNYVNARAVNSKGQEVMGYIQLAGLGGALNTLFPTRYNNIEPRIGIAYRLPPSFRWMKVVRTGYGISHTPTSGLFRDAIPNLNPQAGQLASTGGADGGWVNMDINPLVPPQRSAQWPANGVIADLTSVSSIAFMNQDVTIPYVQQWNFGLGFEFGKSYGLEVNYVGSKSTNMFGPSAKHNTVDLKRYVDQYLAGYNMSDRFPNPFGFTDANENVITVSRQDLMRPNPMTGSMSNPMAQGYNGGYNGLQTQLQKRFTHGLQFNVNYTFSKAMDSASCEGQFCATSLGNFSSILPQLYGGDRKLERSVSTYDMPHIVRFSYNWDLPVGRGKLLWNTARGVINQVVGNWKFGGIGTVQAGKPWYALLGDNAGWPDDVGAIRPNWNQGVPMTNPGWRQQINDPTKRYAWYLNPTQLFSPPARLTVGNAPRAITYARMPWTQTYNMSILKEFPIHEQKKLVFRAELFGALNHPTFIGNVNSNTLYQSLDYKNYTVPPVTTGNIRTTFSDMTQNVGGNRTIQLGLKFYF